jgi:hypothetical protein
MVGLPDAWQRGPGFMLPRSATRLVAWSCLVASTVAWAPSSAPALLRLPAVGGGRCQLAAARRAPLLLRASVVPPPDVGPEEATECPTDEVSTPDLLRFIVPTLGSLVSSEVMSVIDTAIVGSCSASELAALGPGAMLIDSSSYLFYWLNVATTSLFASALAAGKTQEAYDTLSDALYTAVACGVLMTLLMAWCGRATLVAICSSALEVVPAANRYLSIRLLGLPAFMAGTVLQAACLGARDSISPRRHAQTERPTSAAIAANRPFPTTAP